MPADPRTIRLLLLEDNPDDVFLLKAALARPRFLAFEIVHVERLQDAIRKLDEENVDVVVTDLNLPDSVGVATVKELVKYTGSLPVIALTGWEDPAFGAELIEAGAFAYWSKDRIGGPDLPAALVSAVDRAQARS